MGLMGPWVHGLSVIGVRESGISLHLMRVDGCGLVAGEADAGPLPQPGGRRLAAIEATLGEAHAEAALADGPLTVLVAPVGVGAVEGLRADAGVLELDAPFGEEPAEDVHVGPVFVAGGLDGEGFGEAAGDPV